MKTKAMKRTNATAGKYGIKIAYSFYAGTCFAPKSGWIYGPEIHEGSTGKVTRRKLAFDTVADACDFLCGDDGFSAPLEYDGAGSFSPGGVYVTRHGEYSRPVSTIVSLATGRASKAIVREISEEMEKY